MTLFTYPCANLPNYQNTLMHKSEPKANLAFIIRASKVYEHRVGPLGLVGVLVPSYSNSKVDLISHYKELTKLQYLM